MTYVSKRGELPPPTLLDSISHLLTRLDSLLEYIAMMQTEMKAIFQQVTTVNYQLTVYLSTLMGVKPPAPPAGVPAITVVVPPAAITVVAPPAAVAGGVEKIYAPKEDAVKKGTPAKLRIKEETKLLGKTSRWGFIYAVDGTITVRINQKDAITLDRGMLFPWHEYNLAVDEMEITTESVTDVKYRLLAI